MLQPKFKKGDWCFCEFILQQIKSTKENRITSVTDGYMELSSYDLSDRCFPISLEIKRASDEINHWSKKFHSLKFNGLNYPDLNRALISKWVGMCESIENEEKLKSLYQELSKFGRSIIEKVDELKYVTVDEVKIFSK